MKKKQSSKSTEGEVMGSVPMEMLGGGHTIVRFENETQMAIAVQRPRNLAAIRDKAHAELDAFPDMAEYVVYLVPVGKKKVKLENGSEVWAMQYAEELNIRAAENLFRLWGNAASGVVPLEEDDDKVSFLAVYLDYETNGRMQRFGYASKKYKDTKGVIKVVQPDRFAKTTLPAAISRVLRETILRSLPHGLKEAYKEKAYQIFGKKYTPAQCEVLWNKMKKEFAEIDVNEAELGIISGKPYGEKLTARDLLKMRTLYKQLKSGETSKAEILGDELATIKAQVASEMQGKDTLRPGKHEPPKKEEAPPPPPKPKPKPEPAKEEDPDLGPSEYRCPECRMILKGMEEVRAHDCSSKKEEPSDKQEEETKREAAQAILKLLGGKRAPYRAALAQMLGEEPTKEQAERPFAKWSVVELDSIKAILEEAARKQTGEKKPEPDMDLEAPPEKVRERIFGLCNDESETLQKAIMQVDFLQLMPDQALEMAMNFEKVEDEMILWSVLAQLENIRKAEKK